MNPLEIGLGAISGLTSLGGLLGGNAAARRAKAARDAALAEISRQLDEDYRLAVTNNRRNLLSATGVGGDAIRALGSNLGAALAGAGVYNSSATAGALTQATADQGANLARLAADNNFNEKSLLGQNRRYLSNLKLGYANQDYADARERRAGAQSGLMSFLGSLGQYNLARSGENQSRNALPRALGGYGNPSVLKPGAGMTILPAWSKSFRDGYA